MRPALNATWVPTTNSPASPTASASEGSGPKRRLASGSAAANSRIRATLIQPGADFSGKCSKDRGGRVGLDLDPGHRAVGRRGVEVLQCRLRLADEYDLPPEVVRRQWVAPAVRWPVLFRVIDARERDPRDRVLRSGVVDPLVAAEPRAGGALDAWPIPLRPRTASGAGRASRPSVGRHPPGWLFGNWGSASCEPTACASEDPAPDPRKKGLAGVGGRLSRAKDRHAGVVVDRVQQRVVVTPEGQTRDVTGPPNRALGLEVDVEHDRRGVLGGEIVDQRGVVGPRERKRVEIVVRLVVDRDDHDVLGRVLRAADREAPVDRAALERAQQACGVQRDADRRGSDRD